MGGSVVEKNTGQFIRVGQQNSGRAAVTGSRGWGNELDEPDDPYGDGSREIVVVLGVEWIKKGK